MNILIACFAGSCVFFLISLVDTLYPEAFSKKTRALWRFYYEDRHFYMADSHVYTDGNDTLAEAWLFKFPDKPRCDVLLCRRTDGRLVSLIMKAGFGEILVSPAYRTLSRKMSVKLAASIGIE